MCLAYPGAELLMAGSALASLPAAVHRLCASNCQEKKLPRYSRQSEMETKLTDETQREPLLSAAIAWSLFLMLLKEKMKPGKEGKLHLEPIHLAS